MNLEKMLQMLKNSSLISNYDMVFSDLGFADACILSEPLLFDNTAANLQVIYQKRFLIGTEEWDEDMDLFIPILAVNMLNINLNEKALPGNIVFSFFEDSTQGVKLRYGNFKYVATVEESCDIIEAFKDDLQAMLIVESYCNNFIPKFLDGSDMETDALLPDINQEQIIFHPLLKFFLENKNEGE